MGVRPPSDSTDRVIHTFFVIYNHGINVYMVDRVLSICFYIRFYQVYMSGSVCSIRTSGLDYLESIHIFTHTAQYTFSYIYRSLYRVIHILYIC